MMNRFSVISRGRAGISAWAVLMGSLVLAAPVFAQTSPMDTPATFAIPAEDLGDALNGVAIAANLQIFFEALSVAGRTSPAIDGTMSARDALALLLAGTNLDFHQNAEGTVLIRVRAPRPAPPPIAQAPPPAVAAAPAPTSVDVPATQGPWVLRARGIYADQRNHSDAVDAATAPPVLIPENGVGTNDRWEPELDLEYFFAPHWSMELAATAPVWQDLDVSATTPVGVKRVGSYQQMFDALSFKYSFFPTRTYAPTLASASCSAPTPTCQPAPMDSTPPRPVHWCSWAPISCSTSTGS